jgi:hypothetical protein
LERGDVYKGYLNEYNNITYRTTMDERACLAVIVAEAYSDLFDLLISSKSSNETWVLYAQKYITGVVQSDAEVQNKVLKIYVPNITNASIPLSIYHQGLNA